MILKARERLKTEQHKELLEKEKRTMFDYWKKK